LVSAHNRAAALYDELYELLYELNALEMGLHFPEAWNNCAALYAAKAQSGDALNGGMDKMAGAETDALIEQLNALADTAEGWKPKLRLLLTLSKTLKGQFTTLDGLYDEMASQFDTVTRLELVLPDEFTAGFNTFLTDDDDVWRRWDTLCETAGALSPEALLAEGEAFRETLENHTARLREILAELAESLAETPETPETQ
jgi:hypothetical protein